MKKGLVRLLLSGLVFVTFASYNSKPYYYNDLIQHIKNTKKRENKKVEEYIPLEKELRAIEKEKYDEETNNCKHKGLKYYNLLKENKEIAHLVSGLVPSYKNPHIWIYVLNQKTKTWHMIDPTWKKEKDGLLIEDYPERKVCYIFKRDVNMRDIEKKRKCLKKFKEHRRAYNLFYIGGKK